MNEESLVTSGEQCNGTISRRVFVRAAVIGGASLLAGRGVRLFAAASANDDSSFTIGGDLPVRRLGFGAMRLTGEGIWGWPPDRENALKVLRRAVELGVNLIDTADAYGPETDELLIAQALYPYPKGLVIATKGGNTRPGPDQWVPDGRPDYLKGCVDKSLKRLKLERIDYITINFLQWFLTEQLEEVSSMDHLLKIVERAGDDLLQADEYLARVGVRAIPDPAP